MHLIEYRRPAGIGGAIGNALHERTCQMTGDYPKSSHDNLANSHQQPLVAPTGTPRSGKTRALFPNGWVENALTSQIRII
jgi:hypothetical protein